MPPTPVRPPKSLRQLPMNSPKLRRWMSYPSKKQPLEKPISHAQKSMFFILTLTDSRPESLSKEVCLYKPDESFILNVWVGGYHKAFQVQLLIGLFSRNRDSHGEIEPWNSKLNPPTVYPKRPTLYQKKRPPGQQKRPSGKARLACAH